MSELEAPRGRRPRDWVLTPSAFTRLLNWLDDGVSSDGQRYVEIRRRLRAYFERKGCADADDLADETLTRVARRLEEEGVDRGDAPARYCYIVARFVFLEHLRERKRQPTVADDARLADHHPAAQPADDEERGARERTLSCLETCVDELDPLNRRIITQYYIGSERVKIDNRRALAGSLGLTMNALSIRACRIRARLEACVRRCAGAA